MSLCPYQLIFTTGDIGNLHVVGGWRQIFHLLASENVQSDQVNLRVTVLASLGGGHVDDLARATFDDNEAVLSQGGTLHRVGGRSTSIGGLEGVFMLERRRVSNSTDRRRGSLHGEDCQVGCGARERNSAAIKAGKTSGQTAYLRVVRHGEGLEDVAEKKGEIKRWIKEIKWTSVSDELNKGLRRVQWDGLEKDPGQTPRKISRCRM